VWKDPRIGSQLSPVIDSVRGAFPGRDPIQPNTLTSFTSPCSPHLALTRTPPLTTSHPGRSNRQTAPRGTGEGFRLCRKPTSHPIPPSTAFVHPLLLIKKILFCTMDVFFAWADITPIPNRSGQKSQGRAPGSAGARRPHTPQQNTTLMTRFNRGFFSAVSAAPSRSQSPKGPNARKTWGRLIQVLSCCRAKQGL
jgi:hypothetical protein